MTKLDTAAGDLLDNGALLNNTAIDDIATISLLSTTVERMERHTTLAGRALVVVIDDRAARGDTSDMQGPLVSELLVEEGFLVDGTVVVSSEELEIRNALNTAVIGGVDLVVSVGGTGVAPRDITPEVTIEMLDREIPGLPEALRASALAAGSVDGGLSRGVAGISGSTLVVNLAGSRESGRDAMAPLPRLARHIIGEISHMDD